MEGEVVEGIHEKLISREISLKVNKVQNNNTPGYTTTEENDNIPLKRYLCCEYCGEFLRGYIVQKKGIYYYKCNSKGCNCNRNAERLHDHFFEDILSGFTLNSESLIPLIRKQMLTTYYKLTESEIDDRATLLNSIQEVDKKLERQKTRLKEEEITYDLYLEFKSDYEKEREELKKELTKCGQGVSNPQECIDFAIEYSLKLPFLRSSADIPKNKSCNF